MYIEEVSIHLLYIRIMYLSCVSLE